HAGDFQAAAVLMDEAQSLDTADRFVNCKCTKYLLRANHISVASEVAGKFTREGSSPGEYLKEMQCMWFELDSAKAYRRLKKYGEALKKCHEIERHFQEFIEDQFDFHSYCLRKMVLCAYVDMLNLEDHIKGHRFFRQAAQLAVEIYIRLYDHPLSENDSDKNENADNISASEMKKHKNKQRRQQAREQQEKQKQIEADRKKKESQRNKNKDDGEEEKIKEEELVGEKLERSEKPLDEAMRFLQPLEDFSQSDLETQYLGFEVYYRRLKCTLMLRCLKRMKKFNPNYPKFHSCLMKFLMLIQKHSWTDERLKVLIEEELKTLYKHGRSIEDMNADFIEKHSDSLAHRIEASKVMLLLNPSNNTKAIQFLTTLSPSSTDQNYTTCSGIYESLRMGDFGQCDTQIIENYRSECHKLWPLANVFLTVQSQPQQQQQETNSTSPPSPYSSSSVSILVLGCRSSGKSLLIKRLDELSNGLHQKNFDEFIHIQSTIGKTLTLFKWKRKMIELHELGGILAPIWKSSYSSSSVRDNKIIFDKLIYIIDTTQATASSFVIEHLENIILNFKRNILIILNKYMEDNSMTQNELNELFDLKTLVSTQTQVNNHIKLKNRVSNSTNSSVSTTDGDINTECENITQTGGQSRIEVMEINVKTGHNLHQLMEWIAR
ncbi:unnamed protein product, partial [Didymodactylos carnosus]